MIERTRISSGSGGGRAPAVSSLALVCLFALLAWPAAKSGAQSLAAGSRVVEGKVLTSSGAQQPNAIVYLENEKSQVVKTYITTADGDYRFGQLGSDADYRLWAKYRGSKSKTHMISSFDSKQQFTFDLKLESRKESEK